MKSAREAGKPFLERDATGFHAAPDASQPRRELGLRSGAAPLKFIFHVSPRGDREIDTGK